uniref:Serpin domain-containing protein n=1 Tax=Wuchereria bancrofti TaxID=6293 RepID=A0AAF5PKH8_WUCBA
MKDAQLITTSNLDLWANTAFRMFLSIINDRGERNDIICVPQLIALIAFLCEVIIFLNEAEEKIQVAEHQSRLSLSEFLHLNGTATLPHQLIRLAEYIRNWELFIEAAVKPGSFNWNRRLLIHPLHTKSYGFETFMALKYLGIELKIYDEKTGRAELVAWLRRTCKTEGGEAHCPIFLWKKAETKTSDVQELNNQKCPILILASHFYIPMSTNILDTHNIFYITFKGKNLKEVLACRYSCHDLPPFRCLQIQKSLLITLPTYSDDIAAYCMSNADDSDMAKDPNSLVTMITFMRSGTEAESVRILHELYVPLFHGLPNKTTNIADALCKTVPHIDKLFQPDGFGDLGTLGHEPSYIIGPRLTTSIQSIDRLEVMHTPGPDEIEVVKRIPPAVDKMSILDMPFLVIIWDNSRNVPLYIARIADPVAKTTNMHVDATEELVPSDYSGKFFWKLLNPIRCAFGLGNNTKSLNGQEITPNLQ